LFSGVQYYNNGTGIGFSDGFYVGQNNLTLANEVLLWNYENSDMWFGTNGTARMIIRGSGQIDFFNALRPNGNAGNAGDVLVSNGAGGAPSWQGPTSISVRQFSSNIVVPSGVDVPITQWATILNEDGGANYNNVTGEYTIPVSGYYQVNAAILWDVYPSNAAAVISLYVNGLFENQGYSTMNTNIAASSQLAMGKRFNAGDKLQFTAKQWSGVNQTLTGSYFGQNFSIELIHR